MNDLVIFRCIDDEVVMALNEEVDFQELISAIKSRLTLFKENKEDKPNKVIIDLGHRKIKPYEILELFDLIFNEGITLIGGIRSKYQEVEEQEVYEGSIRGGQIKCFDKSVLILGDIHPEGTVYAIGDVYVAGNVKGKIVVRNKNAKIVATAYRNCFVQIFDSELEFIESLDGNVIDYNAGKVRINDEKGELIDGKNNCSNIG